MMCAEVLLLAAWRGHAAGTRVVLALNTAAELIEAGVACWS
jgi:hypothetical protein